jgi:hypothetical protein
VLITLNISLLLLLLLDIDNPESLNIGVTSLELLGSENAVELTVTLDESETNFGTYISQENTEFLALSDKCAFT